MIGYGTEGGDDYWLLKNSWGTDWGELGYIRLKHLDISSNSSGMCGIYLDYFQIPNLKSSDITYGEERVDVMAAARTTTTVVAGLLTAAVWTGVFMPPPSSP